MPDTGIFTDVNMTTGHTIDPAVTAYREYDEARLAVLNACDRQNDLPDDLVEAEHAAFRKLMRITPTTARGAAFKLQACVDWQCAAPEGDEDDKNWRQSVAELCRIVVNDGSQEQHGARFKSPIEDSPNAPAVAGTTSSKMMPQKVHPDATLFRGVARFRDAWLKCEMAWNADDLETAHGTDDSSRDTLARAFENLELLEGCLYQMLVHKPKTIRGAWAYLELMRDLANHLRINPDSSISDIDYAPHLAGIAEGLGRHLE
jgi:hypothetical protein